MVEKSKDNVYEARLDIDYPKNSDRMTTLVRLVLALPILIVLGLLTATGNENTFMYNDAGNEISYNVGGIVTGLFLATALLVVFRQRYPKWWFDFSLELNRFSTRVMAYVLLLTDKYPSTVDKQSVHLELDYPSVKQDLNRWLPLVKWILAVPHYVVLFFLVIGVLLATIMAWFAILITGKYPKDLFDFVVGVFRYSLRIDAYAFLLITDKYPPFSLK